jgi:hypothetical protein
MPSMSTDNATTPRTLDDIDRELQDPEQWDWETPVTLTISPDLTIDLGIRLSREELRLLSAAADAADMKLSDYIKEAAIAATNAKLVAR